MVRGLIGQESSSWAGFGGVGSAIGGVEPAAAIAAGLAAGVPLSAAGSAIRGGWPPITWANAAANSSNEMPGGCDSNGGSGEGAMERKTSSVGSQQYAANHS
jgi:hypothetical protein